MKERLQKIIARSGLASRRKAEDLIRGGMVTVNGTVITQLGSLADPQTDHVKVNGKLLRAEPLEYFAVNKPRGMLSTVSDPERRPVVTKLVPTGRRVYPVGRLDYNSEGLIILTNDGELAERVLEGEVDKVYQVKVHLVPEEDKLRRLVRGITVDGVAMKAEKIRRLESVRTTRDANNAWYEVVLRQGKNRQIRKMFERIGHNVMRLRRVSIGPVKLGKLRTGEHRHLTEAEISALKGRKD